MKGQTAPVQLVHVAKVYCAHQHDWLALKPVVDYLSVVVAILKRAAKVSRVHLPAPVKVDSNVNLYL